MFAPDDVKNALHELGFTSNDVHPENDPTYTEFRRGNEVFSICFGVEGEALNIIDVINMINDRLSADSNHE